MVILGFDGDLHISVCVYIYTHTPDAPCMEYLPTFGSFLGQMLVNIPHMEHMGVNNIYIYTRQND